MHFYNLLLLGMASAKLILYINAVSHLYDESYQKAERLV